jgi:hypothetical protein
VITRLTTRGTVIHVVPLPSGVRLVAEHAVLGTEVSYSIVSGKDRISIDALQARTLLGESSWS